MLIPALMVSAGHLLGAEAFVTIGGFQGRCVSALASPTSASNGGLGAEDCGTIGGFQGRCTSALASSTSASNNGEKDAVSSSNTPSLYEVLGARPSDSQVTLRSRYTALARELHPDAPGGDAAQFTEVAAAWNVLGDKQARLRYDRSMQASEFAEGVVHALEMGVKTAIPFLQNTASTTMSAVDKTSKTMKKTAEVTSRTVKDVSGTLERARGRLNLEQKKKSMEQKAAQGANRAKRLSAERDSILSGDTTARLPELRADATKLTPSQATRLLKKLGEASATAPNLYREIDILEEYVQVGTEKIKAENQVKTAAEVAAKEKEEALLREATAVQKLEEARKELEAARKHLLATKQQEVKALQDERRASAEAETASRNIEQHQEAVRKKLQMKEEEVLNERARQLKMECEELMKNQMTHEADAQELARLIMDVIEEEKERGGRNGGLSA